jgi:hypothetical protein
MKYWITFISILVLIFILFIILHHIEVWINLANFQRERIKHPKAQCNKVDNLLLCVVRRKKYFVNPLDAVVSKSLRNGHYWETFMHKYFKKYSDNQGIALDIGANIGTHSIILSDLFAKVHAFECQSQVFSILSKNKEINNCDNLILHNIGLGESHSKQSLSKFDSSIPYNIGGVSIVKNKKSNREMGEQVEIIPLDSMEFDLPIRFIKMDVEGYELFVLKGAPKTISKHLPVIIFEEHNWFSPVFAKLKSFNYKIKAISRHDYLAIPPNKN